MKLISVYNNFANTGGAQDVTIMLATHFAQHDCKPIVLTKTPVGKIDDKYADVAEFMSLNYSTVRHLIKANDKPVFLSHDRKSTTRLMLYSCMGLDFRLIHVAHSTFNTLKYLTVFPREVVAISKAVYDNLSDYFKVDSSRISMIHNGIADKGMRKPRQESGIRILLAGRICAVKRQVELARRLKDSLLADVQIDFAGVGEDEEALISAIEGISNIRYIGQINVDVEIENYDYVLLFSEKEGLPTSLIEACMYGKPMVTNDIPGIKDINIDGETGFVCKDYDDLISCLSSLPHPDSEEYGRMSCNARMRYEQQFAQKRMFEDYESLILSGGL